MLRRIYCELVEIRKELQAIQKSMESTRNNVVNNYNSDLVKQEVLNTLNHPIQLSPDSIARRIRLEQNGE